MKNIKIPNLGMITVAAMFCSLTACNNGGGGSSSAPVTPSQTFQSHLKYVPLSKYTDSKSFKVRKLALTDATPNQIDADFPVQTTVTNVRIDYYNAQTCNAAPVYSANQINEYTPFGQGDWISTPWTDYQTCGIYGGQNNTLSANCAAEASSTQSIRLTYSYVVDQNPSILSSSSQCFNSKILNVGLNTGCTDGISCGFGGTYTMPIYSQNYISQSTSLNANSQLTSGQPFYISLLLNGPRPDLVTPQTLSLTIKDAGGNIASNILVSPSSCVLGGSATATSCVFTVTPQWNSAASGTYSVNVNNNATTQILGVANIPFTVTNPTINLSQTGEEGDTLNCSLITGSSDCTFKYGIDFVTRGSARFTPYLGYNLGCVTDNLTGLTWAQQQYSSSASGPAIFTTWAAALLAVQAVNNSTDPTQQPCAQTGWRLPTVNELRSLVNYQASVAPDYSYIGYLKPLFNVSMDSTGAYDFWTSSISGSGTAWVMSFDTGPSATYMQPYVRIYSDSQIQNHGVWLVKGTPIQPTTIPNTVALVPQTGESSGMPGCPTTGSSDCNSPPGVAWPTTRFVADQNPGCATDSLTGLMWLRNLTSITSPRNWESAMAIINMVNNGAGWCGYNDWRMPNINELMSLNNYGTGSLTVWLASQGFTGLPSSFASYWSSSVGHMPSSFTQRAMFYIEADSYSMSTSNPVNSLYFIPVRGGH